jgi:hypothetical protein
MCLLRDKHLLDQQARWPACALCLRSTSISPKALQEHMTSHRVDPGLAADKHGSEPTPAQHRHSPWFRFPLPFST